MMNKQSTIITLLLLSFILTSLVQSQSCTICPDGNDPPNPTKLVEIPGIGSTSCNVLNNVVRQSLLDEDDDTCQGIRFLTASECGCTFNSNNNFCSLCPDGSLPMTPNLILEQNSSSLTCQSVFNSLQFVSNQSETCMNATSVFAVICLCPNVTSDCTLCEPNGGNNFDMDDEMCRLAANDAPFIPNAFCTAYRATAGIYCGCNNTIASQGYCRICGNDQLLPEPNRLIQLQDEENITCAELEFNSIGMECNALQELFRTRCCQEEEREPRQRPKSCNICPNGGSPRFNNTIQWNDRNISCFSDPILVVNNDDCIDFQSTAASTCDCPIPCICPDGPPPLENTILLPGFNQQEINCTDLAAAVTVFTRQQCTSLEFFAKACGCVVPNLGQPCQLCANGAMPNKPNVLITGENGIVLATCQDLAMTLSFIPEDSIDCLPEFNDPAIQQLCECP